MKRRRFVKDVHLWGWIMGKYYMPLEWSTTQQTGWNTARTRFHQCIGRRSCHILGSRWFGWCLSFRCRNFKVELIWNLKWFLNFWSRVFSRVFWWAQACLDHFDPLLSGLWIFAGQAKQEIKQDIKGGIQLQKGLGTSWRETSWFQVLHCGVAAVAMFTHSDLCCLRWFSLNLWVTLIYEGIGKQSGNQVHP